MSDRFDDYERWDADPLGTIPLERGIELLQRPVREVAPIFCELFAKSVFMVRKYVDWRYSILPPPPAFNTSGWLFHPSGPIQQEDLLEVERLIGNGIYFQAYMQFTPPFHRLRRIERVLAWLKDTNGPRLAEMSKQANKLAPRTDLTSLDDLVCEAIVAAVAAGCSRSPASAFTFLSSKKDQKTPEFRVATNEISATLEVKHLLKYPQSTHEDFWLRAYQERKGKDGVRRDGMPHDAAGAIVMELLQTAPEKETVGNDQIPWQKRVAYISEHLEKADRQLGAAVEPGARVIVLYSDDPHILTRSEERPDEKEPSENRIERAIEATLGRLDHADAVVLLAHPHGFPIESGHCVRIFPRPGGNAEAAKALFGCLPELRPQWIEPCAIGVKVPLAPGGTDTVELKIPPRTVQ